ncbi:MAG: penicillin-binding transpeptidase domain-containing protein [Myxococcota bacterium]
MATTAEWAIQEPRWQRDQRSRRGRRMTGRGRATLASGGLAFAIGLAWLIEPISSRSAERPPEPLPPVEAAAPPVAKIDRHREPEVVVPPRAPSFVLERLPMTRTALDLPVTGEADASPPASLPGRLFERFPAPANGGTYTVEYTLDAELTRQVHKVLRRARVELGNVIVMDPEQGRVLAYASTDPERFPPTRNYPAASLVKVITAAAALDRAPSEARLPCRYRGSPYRLTESRLDPPDRGREVTLRKALATSNNQCFAQLAVHAVGVNPLIEAIGRFGWLRAPAPAHAPGEADPGEDRLDVGRLGCGLAGCRITPLHAAQLAGTLVHGELVTPRWIERAWDPRGRALSLPATPANRQVLDPDLMTELRAMLIDTTRKGTARRAFRKRNGHPMLGDIRVAGKTGSLSGKDPEGRYEWFVGVAPADKPRVAIATVLVQGHLYWRTSSQVAAEVLQGVFCEKGKRCAPELADRYSLPGRGTQTLAQRRTR